MNAHEEALALGQEQRKLWANVIETRSAAWQTRADCVHARIELHAGKEALRNLQRRIAALSIAPRFNVPAGMRACRDGP